MKIFFLDTNFFLDFPDFTDSFVFDTDPYIVVLCLPILSELNKLKKSIKKDFDIKEEKAKSDSARWASRTTDAVQDEKKHLPFGGKFMSLDKNVRADSVDEALIQLAKNYAESHKTDTVTILSSDVNLRILAKTKAVAVSDPLDWLKMYRDKYHPSSEYVGRVITASKTNMRVKKAYEARMELELILQGIEKNRHSIAREYGSCLCKLIQAREVESKELKRYEIEKKARQEKIFEERKRDEAKRLNTQKKPVGVQIQYQQRTPGLKKQKSGIVKPIWIGAALLFVILFMTSVLCVGLSLYSTLSKGKNTPTYTPSATVAPSATADNRLATIQAWKDNGSMLFSAPQSGNLEITGFSITENCLYTRVNVKNFVLEITFVNPDFDPSSIENVEWWFDILFQYQEDNWGRTIQGWNLQIRKNSIYRLYDMKYVLGTDYFRDLTAFTLDPGAKNKVTLAVKDSIGYIVFNDARVENINLAHEESGDILVCYSRSTGVSESARYEDFMIWEIKK